MVESNARNRPILTEAEKHFRYMCDKAPILVWMANPTGEFFFFNKPWRAYTGRNTEEAGIDWLDDIHAEDRAAFRERFQKNFTERTPFRAEYRLRRYDGIYRWVITHAAPYYNTQEQFSGYVSTCFDFNDQHEFETTLATRALKQTALATFGRFALAPHSFAELTREAVNVILETLHVDCAYLASIDTETRQLTLEDCACRLGKKPPHELGAVTPTALTLSRAIQLNEEPNIFPLRELLVKNGIRSALLCPVGSGKDLYGYLFANTRATRTFSPEAIDFIQGLANILSTVNQRERAEKALATSEQKLLQSQKVEAIGLLAGGIAHDFNNLLTAVRGYTDLLRKDIRSLPTAAQSQVAEHHAPADDTCCGTVISKPTVPVAQVAQDLRAHTIGITKAVDRAANLVRQLLTFSRAYVAQVESINLNTLILDVKELIEAFLRSGIELDLQLSPTPVIASVDRNQIEQVVLNLAINARDAMPEGGRLTISTGIITLNDTITHPTLSKGSYAMFAITDTGTGIPPEVQAKIFAPFFTTKAKNRGTGLGLPTCANIVKNARGDITFTTEMGKGTTFTVLLPSFASTEQDISLENTGHTSFFPTSDTANPLREVIPTTRSDSQTDMDTEPDLPSGTETLVLVEDDPAIRDVTTAILQSLGYTVHAFRSGDEFLKNDRIPAQLLITDLNMPGMSGRQLAERIKEQQPDMRVLFISGFVAESLRQTKAHYLEKPFTRDVLAQKVRDALR